MDLRGLLQRAVRDRFTVQRELGYGGMGVVFLARRTVDGAAVAVKLLQPEFARMVGIERFHREIALLRELQHPHILPLIESGQAGPLPFYVMPYADQGSLRHRLDRDGRLSVAEALDVAAAAAAALDYAHASNIVHRDVKPENLLFAGGCLVVSDFGVARAILRAGGESLSSSGFVAGTPGYMSPEQASGSRDLDGRSDLYSLGCVMFEALCGQPPFTAVSAQGLLARHAHDPPPSLRAVRPDLPACIEAAVHSALAKQAEQRPPSGAEFVARLKGLK